MLHSLHVAHVASALPPHDASRNQPPFPAPGSIVQDLHCRFAVELHADVAYSSRAHCFEHALHRRSELGDGAATSYSSSLHSVKVWHLSCSPPTLNDILLHSLHSPCVALPAASKVHFCDRYLPGVQAGLLKPDVASILEQISMGGRQLATAIRRACVHVRVRVSGRDADGAHRLALRTPSAISNGFPVSVCGYVYVLLNEPTNGIEMDLACHFL